MATFIVGAALVIIVAFIIRRMIRDKKKGKEYTIEVKVLNLRVDLEKNGIKRKLGI